MSRKNINPGRAFKLLAFSLLTVLNITCQKDVDPIMMETGFSISGTVLISDSKTGLEGVQVFNGDTLLSVTNSNGIFTISNITTGQYLLRFYKTGYTEAYNILEVASCQGYIPVINLKPLAPPVVITDEGGKVEAFFVTGKLAAELEIPADVVNGEVNVSSTVLFGNEAPPPVVEANKIQGTVISFTADKDVDLNKSKLTFVLPYMLKPGDSVAINYFNKTEQEWQLFTYATVEPDNLTVTVEVDELNIYSLVLNGTYTELSSVNNSCGILSTSSNYSTQYSWNSYLNYQSTIPGTDETAVEEVKIFLNQTIESYTRISFSDFTYLGLPKETNNTSMFAAISTPPIGNPSDYASLPSHPWELVKHCCIVNDKVVLNIFDPNSGAYKAYDIRAKHLKCYFDWMWRANETYGYCQLMSCANGNVIIPADIQHSGGAGN